MYGQNDIDYKGAEVQQHYHAPSAPKYIEKKEAIESVRPIPHETEKGSLPKPETEEAWKPGFVRRFPWLGFSALIVVVCCMVAAIVVLVVSDGKPQADQSWEDMRRNGLLKNHWPKQIRPSVILSILNNISNLAFGLAIANGIAIAWWRKALLGSTIEQLHKSWEFSSSIKSIVFAGRAFNGIALAALATKLTIIDGVLMQSATTTIILPDPKDLSREILSWSNETIPITGRRMGRSQVPGLLSTWFGGDLITWDAHPAILPYKKFSGCENATCFLKVPGAGFEFDCSEPVSKSISWDKDLASTDSNGSAILKSAKMFDVSFDTQNSLYRGLLWATEHPTLAQNTSYSPPGCAGTEYSIECYTQANLSMHIMYTQSGNESTSNTINGTTYTATTCPGTRVEQTCVLRPAVINYPVMLRQYGGANQESGISLLPERAYLDPDYVPFFDRANKQQDGFEVLRYSDIIEDAAIGIDTGSRLSGLQLGLNMYLGGHADISYDAYPGYQVSQQENAPQYLLNAPGPHECGYRFNNPMNPVAVGNKSVQSVVASINQIMFALSIDLSDSDPSNNKASGTWRSYPSTIYTESIHFDTRYPYMFGAMASTLLCILFVLPVYWGFWQLGRKVSLGPFEIAHAFRSPMTAEAENGDIEHVMKVVGHREVQYGYIASGDARGVFGIAEPENIAEGDPRRD